MTDLSENAESMARAETLIASLPLERKVRLLTGGSFWRTAAEPALALGSLLLSDGPSGVRGEQWDERAPSLCLPSTTCLAASWDTELADRYGETLAHEARAKGVHAVLGPTINLHRSPLGGRHFECFSEDPLLTGALAAAYVRGVQRHGVAAVPKHFVANDSETDRMTVDVRVDERTLREVYLAPFETAVTEGGAWMVMAAYNAVNGTTMTENELLRDPLCEEWGFDGLVVSDWTAVRSTEASAAARMDLAMPGPHSPWGEDLVAAVRAGRVPEDAIDEKVRRLLRLAARVGAPRGEAPPPPADLPREVAAEGMVLLRNAPPEMGGLPWGSGPTAAAPRSVALIGQAARSPRIQGGGSATVQPPHVATPLESLRAALPGTAVSYELGAAPADAPVPLPPHTLTHPVTGGPGVLARFLDERGEELLTEDRLATELVWLGGVPKGALTLELTTRYQPEDTVEEEGAAEIVAELAVACAGGAVLYADGEPVVAKDPADPDKTPEAGAELFAPPHASSRVRLATGRATELRVVQELSPRARRLGSSALTFGRLPVVADPDAAIARAAEAARAAETAVVVVGTTTRAETESRDRASLALPGRQDDLVRAVAAANPRTVVVVNAGSPVLMPWRDDVAAVLVCWFPGQDFGQALADVLLGTREPGGRLPTTWPAEEEDVPVLSTSPVDGRLAYAEGPHLGYRAWLRSGRKPAYAFGHGCGYTTWHLDGLAAPERITPVDGLTATVRVTNTGDRPGKQVVQLYLSRPDRAGAVARPVRWLAGFRAVRLAPGESAEVAVDMPARTFAHWEPGEADKPGGWRHEPGSFTLHAGFSSDELPLSHEVRLA